MPRPGLIGSIYGYLVCLLAIVVFIHGAVFLVSSVFSIASPGPHFGSRAAIASRMMPMDPAALAPHGRQPFRQIVIRSADEGGRLAGLRGLVISLVLLAIAVFLFRWHWRWLRDFSNAVA